MSDVVLNADKIDLVRERPPLLDRVTMTVLRGEHWALIGPNGAGKSTLLGILGAYTHPRAGRRRSSGTASAGWTSTRCGR